MVCECQWGLTGIMLGAVIILAAGVFSFFPFVLHIFTWEWYKALCLAWFLLGASLFGLGILYELFCCPWKKGRFVTESRGKAEARETTEGVDDIASAPTPYIMIA